MHHQFDHQLGELGEAAGRQAPPQHAVVEDPEKRSLA
jgi:hypothetical protein